MAEMIGEKPHAPTLLDDLIWLGTTRNLTREDLLGRVLLLDFFTYSNINCLHTLQLLKGLERRHKNDQFMIIGVHCPKYPHEKERAAVEKAMAKYGITHPVVMDNDLQVWRSFGVRAWPSQVLLDAEGNMVAIGSGEPDSAILEEDISDNLALDGSRGLLRSDPVAPLLSPLARQSDRPFRFPGRIQILPNGLLAIADSGHNRIVICEPDGRVRWIAGNGQAGLDDGDHDMATFAYPQGMAWVGDDLYVADAGNHALRKINLVNRRVETVAGDGHLARAILPVGYRAKTKEVQMRSPWDLESTVEGVAIAMTGAHQIWTYNPKDQTIGPVAGTGREGLFDGPAKRCSLAQPSSVAVGVNPHHLYFVDSETSALRMFDFATRQVSTKVGRGLFTFGDKDGTGTDARLQHPLCLVSGPDEITVADTYNNKIRAFDPVHARVETLVGSELDGLYKGLDEPEGVAETADGRLLICDTNNHRLVEVVRRTAGPARELPINAELP